MSDCMISDQSSFIANETHTRHTPAQELVELSKSPPLGISAGPIEDDMFHWQGSLSILLF